MSDNRLETSQCCFVVVVVVFSVNLKIQDGRHLLIHKSDGITKLISASGTKIICIYTFFHCLT